MKVVLRVKVLLHDRVLPHVLTLFGPGLRATQMDPRTVGPVLLGTPVGLASGLDEPICGLLREKTLRAVSERAFEQDQVNIFFFWLRPLFSPSQMKMFLCKRTHACLRVRRCV